MEINPLDTECESEYCCDEDQTNLSKFSWNNVGSKSEINFDDEKMCTGYNFTKRNENRGKNVKTSQKITLTLSSNESFPLPISNYNIGIVCSHCVQSPGRCIDCLEDVLVVQNKCEEKWIVIRERNKHRNFYGKYRLCSNKVPCFRGDACTFAHSEEEAVIWTNEKKNKFGIKSFIQSHRSKTSPAFCEIELINIKFPGSISFTCGKCFLKQSMFCGKQISNFCCNEIKKHNWTENKIMIYNSIVDNTIIPIFSCTERSSFDICQYNKFCNRKGVSCSKPHSVLERDIWMFFNKKECSKEEFVAKFNYFNDTPPHAIKKICQRCWSNNVVLLHGQCPESREDKSPFSGLYYISKAGSLMKDLPRTIPRHNNFKICWNLNDDKTCKTKNCQFAHCREELENWKWMTNYGIFDLNIVARKSENLSKEDRAGTTYSLAQLLHEKMRYCHFCEKILQNDEDMNVHINSKIHADNVRRDNSMQWNYRSPPFKPTYKLCKKNQENRCFYSHVPYDYNFCIYAHSMEELDEWFERKRWKEIRNKYAKQNDFLPFIYKLMQKYEVAEVKQEVMTDHIDDVHITTTDDLVYRSSNKSCQHTWCFEIRSNMVLTGVCLLKRHCRMNFNLLANPNASEQQYIKGIYLISQNDPRISKIYVKFRCEMFGIFSQTVIFDFGTYPVIFKTLRCEIGSNFTVKELQKTGLNTNLARWSLKNEKIFRCAHIRVSEISSKYPMKNLLEIIGEYPINVPLHKNIYSRKMHGLLYLEEHAQTAIVSRYNLKTTIELEQVNGEHENDLYGKFHLSEFIIEGSLILNVDKVLFKPLKTNCEYLFEALIFESNIKGDEVLIFIHSTCCQYLGLKAGDHLEAEIQFQLNRESFCKMHYALDNIKNLEYLFPETIKNNTEPIIVKTIECSELNPKQNKVIKYVFRQGLGKLPPLVLYGPFGTGKTETIAKASLMLAKEKSGCRILICTKSNWSADEYFKRHFTLLNASYVKLMRIYSKNRRLNTVDKAVLPFCLLDSSRTKFCMPTIDDLKSCQIVVTTLETSFNLNCLRVKLGFSHIFIDEAGQDLECRTIIPFMLADEKTCIVIAGDHMQMGEEVYSQEAKDQNFDYSLMERLFHHYRKLEGLGNAPLVCLKENYRNHMDILSFISRVYYGSENTLSAKQAECISNFKQMEFFAVFGEELLNKETGSLYNMEEVEEIVDRVSYTYENWPKSWGRKNASQILVTSPYMDQIRQIRTALKKKSHSLSLVTVIRVHNVPGLEFRAVFISTVKTSSKHKLNCGSVDENFLTQPKLLNSAMSRAKSYLAVIGDPITLCSIGVCSKIWFEFLKKCEEIKSIYPSELALEDVIELLDVEKNLDINEKLPTHYSETGFQLEVDGIIKYLMIEHSEDGEWNYEATSQRLCFEEESLINVDYSSTLDIKETTMYECRIFIDRTRKISAHPMVNYSTFNIIIPSRRHCKTALDRDVVLVEVLNSDCIKQPNAIIYGEVLKIIKPYENIKDRQFVCFVDESCDLMVPVNKKIPKIKVVKDAKFEKNVGPVNIYTCKNNTLKLVTKLCINNSDPYSLLYLVKILKWDKGFDWPLGFVVDTLKPSTKMKDIMSILNLEFNVPKIFEQNLPFYYTNIGQNENRDNYTDLLVFTIDNKETLAIDDAFGLVVSDDGTVTLSIHISDVSYFINPNSALNDEAKKRGASFYPLIEEPVYMFPEIYSTDIFSLKEGEDRKTLSIFMDLDKDNNIVDFWIERTLIRSKYKLSYEEVDLLLMNDVQSPQRFSQELIDALKKMNEISTKWKVQRMGEDAFGEIGEIFLMEGPKARALVKEMMIKANSLVAKFLLEQMPNCTPLRVQEKPIETELQALKTKFSKVVMQSYSFRKYFKTLPNSCNDSSCCVVPITTDELTSTTLEKQKDIAETSLKKIMQKAEYVCSAGDLKHHFSLNVEPYTHFTSPIRRYMDLVVHRLVINCIKNQPSTYTQEEILDICQHCTIASEVAKDYHKATCNALICCFLQDRPLQIEATIYEINDKYEIALHSRKWHKVFRSQLVIKPTHLGVAQQPETQIDYTIFCFNKKIYENSLHCLEKCVMRDEIISNRALGQISDKEFPRRTSRLLHTALNNSYDSNKPEFYSKNMDNSSKEGCLLKLKPTDVLTIQISSKLHRGLLTPYVQLVVISKLASICIEHNSNPIQCFSDFQPKNVHKNPYESIDEYKDLWQPVLSLECVHNAVNNGVPTIIHNVEFQWKHFEKGNDISGIFWLEKNLFKKLQATLFTGEGDIHCNNYICVQYPDVIIPTCGINQIKNAIGDTSQVTVLLHCIVTKATFLKDGNKWEIYCEVKQHTVNSLKSMLENFTSNKSLATVEWIRQLSPMKRMMSSLRKLNKNLKLATEIALNRGVNLPLIVGSKNLPFDETALPKSVKDLKLNTEQKIAVSKAITSQFSLIQGPPGTGKTHVMAHLINQFFNSNEGTEYKVICCGPSNKSADVIATKLLEMNEIPLLRIYGETIENKDFPLSFTRSLTKDKIILEDKNTNKKLTDISLHHLIRNKEKCHLAEGIKKLEDYFNSKEFLDNEGRVTDTSDDIDEKIENYVQLKSEAEKMFISAAKVIITTCTGCGASKLKECQFKQLLIDECSMCTEPESMVPIVSTKAEQVVLIGDHKQLRPIVLNKFAAKLGLEKSLFERYCENAHMLKVQYRMHEAIAEFPSKQFYQGKLVTGSDKQSEPSKFNFWPGGRDTPIVFVNIGGLEESLTTSTEEGGFKSKKNEAQAKLAVEIAYKLVHQFKVEKEDIIILSQYRSQCSEISKMLKDAALLISVSTVVSAQGSERKYVILSTVRSLPKIIIGKNGGRSWEKQYIGFVADRNQINVALTRAKEGLIILGNKDLLSVNALWKNLINHYEKKNALVEENNFELTAE